MSRWVSELVQVRKHARRTRAKETLQKLQIMQVYKKLNIYQTNALILMKF